MKVGTYVGIAVASLVLTSAGCGKHVEADPRTELELVRVAVVAPPEGSTQFFTGVVAARVQSDLGFKLRAPLGRSESTRLNSSHQIISYAVFCLKKKNKVHDKP